MNPLNQLPIDVELMRRNDEFAAAYAKESGQMVLVVMMRENGKAQISLEGVPATGRLAELAEDLPRFLEVTAIVMRMLDAQDEKQTRS